MKAQMQTVLLGAMLTVATAQAGTPQDTDVSMPAAQTRTVRDFGGWESVADHPGPAVRPVRIQRGQAAPRAPEGMQARKAEMVRRMFWIMLAHR